MLEFPNDFGLLERYNYFLNNFMTSLYIRIEKSYCMESPVIYNF